MGDFASGLLLTCTIGLLWSFTGVYYKLMAKWKLNPYDVGILTGIIGIVVNLLFVTKTGCPYDFFVFSRGNLTV